MKEKKSKKAESDGHEAAHVSRNHASGERQYSKKEENKPNFKYIFIPTTPEEDIEIWANYVLMLTKFAENGAAR